MHATKRGICRGISVPVIILLLFGACSEIPIAVLRQLPSNFHAIDPGLAYRSAQPEGEELVAAIEAFGIRTVVNLRGENVGQSWYDEEARVCRELGVTLVDHRMSAKSLPSAELLAAVLETLQTAEYPILIHCRGGADRTGAISAIYRMLILRHDRADAQAELSLSFHHFAFATPCMDKLAEIFETDPAWLEEYAEIVDEIDCTQ